MTLDQIKQQLPKYAYDLKKNFNRVMLGKDAPGLREKEIAAVALASAMNTSSKELAEAIESFVKQSLTAEEIAGAKTAHALMSMTNVYYRFLHVADNNEYKRMPSGLDRTAENDSGLSKQAFELAALAVSAMNNCKACIDFHELSLRRMGVGANGIQSAIRIAATLNAVGETLKFYS